MEDLSESDYSCGECGGDVSVDDDFCPDCGVLFRDNVFCVNHPSQPALAVCLICKTPLCEDCLKQVGQLCFCEKHVSYDIYEGFARVFESVDGGLAAMAFETIKDAGMHPFYVLRRLPSATRIGRMSQNTTAGPHFILVPFCEVESAEKLLTEVNTGQTSDSAPV